MLEIDTERSETYAKNIEYLIAQIKVFYKPELKAMLEAVRADDNGFSPEFSEARIVNPGHDLECCWFLLEEAVRIGDKDLIKFVETVYADALNIGWDEKFGGILYFKDVLGKPVEAYEHDMKLWWPHNEGVIASLMLYLVTRDEKYKAWFEKLVDYAFAHFSEHEKGEWLGYLRRDGVPTEPAVKGHTYKGAFHVMRMLIKCLELLNKF
jgi:N-acylglucosamine 2-epimerase